MTCLGVLNRGEQGNDNETGLMEGEGIGIDNLQCSIRVPLLRLIYLPFAWHRVL